MVDVVVRIFVFIFSTLIWRLSAVACWFLAYAASTFVFVFVRRGWSPAMDAMWDIYAMFFFTFGWITPAVKYEWRNLTTFILTIAMLVDGLLSTFRFWNTALLDKWFRWIDRQSGWHLNVLERFVPDDTDVHHQASASH